MDRAWPLTRMMKPMELYLDYKAIMNKAKGYVHTKSARHNHHYKFLTADMYSMQVWMTRHEWADVKINFILFIIIIIIILNF